jgi:hypothetical protein
MLDKAKPSIGVEFLQGFGPTMVVFIGGVDMAECEDVARKVMPEDMVRAIFDPIEGEDRCAGFCLEIDINQSWIDSKNFKLKKSLQDCIIIVWTDLLTLIHECVHAMCTMSEDYHDDFSEETKCRLVSELTMIGLDSQKSEVCRLNGFTN